VNMGTRPDQWQDHEFEDVSPIEWAAWTPLLVLILVLGPGAILIFGATNADVVALLAAFGA
jgi:NADH:ubiquinone oxidoreductase subunit 4 (subunit M)